MNQDLEEQRLKQLFNDLRWEDERVAPSFSRDWEAVCFENETVPQYRSYFRVVMVIALVIGVGVVLAIFGRETLPGRSPSQHAALSILEWQSPTDFLLQTPGNQLLETVPQLDESYSESMAYLFDQDQ